MKPFTYLRATETSTAIKSATSNQTKFIAGGTNLLDLMKEGVEQPDRLVDITRINLSQIQPTSNGVRIGALAKNSDTANHPLIRTRYPLLSQALLAGGIAATAKYGIGGWQYDAKNPMLLLLQYVHALQ